MRSPLLALLLIATVAAAADHTDDGRISQSDPAGGSHAAADATPSDAKPHDGRRDVHGGGKAQARGFLAFLLSFEAGDGGTYSLDPKTASVFTGGVVLRYEKVTVACERMTFRFSTAPGEERVVEWAELVAGPHAQDHDHVVLDSSKSRLDDVSFHGVMKPSLVTIERQHEALDPPDVLRFLVHLEDVGAFAGSVHGKDGWQPIAGWAQRAEIAVLAQRLDGKIGNIRIGAIHLLGEAADEAKDRRPAWLIELDPAKVKDALAVDIGAIVAQDREDEHRLWTYRAHSVELSMPFTDDGHVGGTVGGKDFVFEGLSNLAASRRKPQVILDE